MKLIIILCLTVFNIQAYAIAYAIIAKTNAKAHIILQGQDDDAKRIYDSLSVQPVPINSMNTKRIASTSGDFQLVCNSSIVTNQASCAVTVFAGLNAFISYEKRQVKFLLNGLDAEKLSALFPIAKDDYIFESRDSHFLLKAEQSVFEISFDK